MSTLKKQNLTSPDSFRRIAVTAVSVVGCLFAASCGRQAYQVVSTSEAQAAPGTYTVPPKVDILLAEDTTGSMYGDYTDIAQQFPGFLNQIETSGWDWHFAAVPLTQQQNITQAFASYHDSNWGTQWQAPYPGAQQWITAPGGGQMLPPDSLSASVFTEFNTSSNIGFPLPSNASGGSEPGLQTIEYAMTTGAQGTGLIRPDALLVVMVIGNGDDTSLVNMCQGPGGNAQANCENFGVAACTSGTAQSNYQAGVHYPNANGQYPGVCGTYNQSIAYYQSLYQSQKSAASQFQFFAAVAAERMTGDGCSGSNSYVGDRYMDIAADTGGGSIDICNNQISTILSTLSSHLQSVKLGYTTGYLFISQVPQVSTIVVTKYPGGNTSNPVTIPQDPNNGWTYAGQVSNVDTIVAPVPMDQASGIAIQLHGSAELVGADTASVSYTPAGASNSETN